MENKSYYRNVIFDSWVNRSGLIREEFFLITNFLVKDLTTLEAGTGGGRILLAMDKLGYKNLSGFDYVPEFISAARAKNTRNPIKFSVKDATGLDFTDGSFQQLIYLQQTVCFIDEANRRKALDEANRILCLGGRALFSFLLWEGQTIFRRLFLYYLRILRFHSGSKRPSRSIPWLKTGHKWRWSALVDMPPHVYWYLLDEALNELEITGFQTEGFGSSRQVRKGELFRTRKEASKTSLEGMLYCVCKKTWRPS